MYHRRGFSLIEVIIAIGVIAAVVGLYTATLKTFSVTRNASHGGVALRIAERELESLRASGYAAVPASGSFSDAQLATLSESASGTLTVSNLNASTKQVVVTVAWEDPAGGARSVSLATLITQTGGL